MKNLDLCSILIVIYLDKIWEHQNLTEMPTKVKTCEKMGNLKKYYFKNRKELGNK